ncbi:nucleotidyl transferase AbiEii/AbiGii toxin family protein [Candidatus Parcubacteria bacterium]|nr:nucleotidyl transferase AbiEii/AbiGii toxin family protein [Candidatus Parcubacteria bacterium]
MAPAQAVDAKTRRNLEALSATGVLRSFYLGGGTGLAFLFGHRTSRDLDFFRRTAFDERRLIERLRAAGSFQLEKRESGTVRGSFQRTLVSFFQYPYQLLAKPRTVAGIRIASPLDIGCMKLDAIVSRGTKRDFIDLYTVLTQEKLSLIELLTAFQRKYARFRPNLMHVKKSLVYFADAERDPNPEMLTAISWQRVKAFFSAEAKKF